VNFLNFHLAPFSPVGAETYRYEPGRFIATSVVDGSERTVVEFDETALPGALQASYGCLETDEGWVYFVTGGDEADGYRYRIWKVRKAGGIPEPAVFRSDRTPMAFVSPFEKFPLSPDGSHVAWGYGEVYRDVWIAEVVHPDPTAR
jgi:hypothetical protein